MRVLSLVVTGLLVTASVAHAGPLTLSNLSGGWNAGSVNADGPATATVQVANQGGSLLDTLEWGTGVNDPNLQSGYTFDPVNGSFDPALSTPFLMGTFQHLNNTITEATSKFLGVDYNFSFDTNGLPGQLSDVLRFQHNETLNVGPCPVGVSPCPDIVTATVLKLSSLLITVGADSYIFELLGFSQDGGFTFSDTFISAEGGANTAQLYAVVTAADNEVPEVPEPASLVLLGCGLVLVARQVRRRTTKRVV